MKIFTIVFLILLYGVYLSSPGLTGGSAFAFDESSMPSQGNGGVLQGSKGLPADQVPKVIQGVSIKENLGKSLDLNLTFTDQNGNEKTLAQILDGKPLILTLNYYRCSTLCSIQLLNLAKSIKDTNWPIGKDYNMATISFDPTDTPSLAKNKQFEYLSIANQSQGVWNFFVGKEENIKKLTDSMGFFYKYDPESKEFAHAAAIFFISPEGKISRYLYGITYAPIDIKFSLMDASKNKIGSPTDQVLLTCFHYNPTSGKYDTFAIGFLRIAAGVAVFVVVCSLFYFFSREKKQRPV